MYAANALEQEILKKTVTAGSEGFTLTKELGTVRVHLKKTEDGGTEPVPMTASEMAVVQDITQNAAAVRLLGEKLPELRITYPQTVLSERETDDGRIVSVRRTDAVIEVPEEYVLKHSGQSFYQLLCDECSTQMTELIGVISERLHKYEFRTERMFDLPKSKVLTLRVTGETVESEIWSVILDRIGFLQMQWDSEIIGMTRLLAERLREVLTLDYDGKLTISVQRNDAQQCGEIRIVIPVQEPAETVPEAQQILSPETEDTPEPITDEPAPNHTAEPEEQSDSQETETAPADGETGND